MLEESNLPISPKLFLEYDTRRIKMLFDNLIYLKKLSLNYIEILADQILSKNFEQALILTGFPKGDTFETDGPLGAIILSDLFKNYLNMHSVILTIPERLYYKIKKCTFFKLSKIELKALESLKIDLEKVTVGITIEFPGPNSINVYHHMNGKELDPSFIKSNKAKYIAPALWTDIKSFNPSSFTIGIGDGGNELGIGQYENEIREIIPFGNICSCPCQKGISSSIPSDIGLLATTSNWASYALASVLGYKFGYNEQLSILNSLNSVGIIDGVTGKRSPTVDGIDPKIEKRILEKIFE